MNEIEQLRAAFEPRLMAIEGVVGVGSGLDSVGRERLKIYLAVPPQQIYERLPPDLNLELVDLEFVGEIEAQ
jgi:hypothetical protein